VTAPRARKPLQAPPAQARAVPPAKKSLSNPPATSIAKPSNRQPLSNPPADLYAKLLPGHLWVKREFHEFRRIALVLGNPALMIKHDF
jgi:hypothetical protein